MRNEHTELLPKHDSAVKTTVVFNRELIAQAFIFLAGALFAGWRIFLLLNPEKEPVLKMNSIISAAYNDSWGYYGPGPVSIANRDNFTLGCVDALNGKNMIPTSYSDQISYSLGAAIELVIMVATGDPYQSDLENIAKIIAQQILNECQALIKNQSLCDGSSIVYYQNASYFSDSNGYYQNTSGLIDLFCFNQLMSKTKSPSTFESVLPYALFAITIATMVAVHKILPWDKLNAKYIAIKDFGNEQKCKLLSYLFKVEKESERVEEELKLHEETTGSATAPGTPR